MASNILQFHRIHGEALAPTRATSGAAGWDLYSDEELVIPAGERKLVATGVRVGIPDGWVGMVKPRSSLALQGITTDAGVIDADYRGELFVLLVNNSDENFWVSAGDRIAQMVVTPFFGNAMVVNNLSDTARADGGFGSTGT